MRTKRPLAVLVGGLVLGAWALGCNETSWGGDSKELVPQPQLGTSDVPIPDGFEMDESGSEDKSKGNWRYIRHLYRGNGDAQVVRAFYRDKMPMEKWQLISDEMQQGQYTLRFDKGGESCEVVISRDSKRWFRKTKLRIEVTGQGKDDAKPIRIKK